MGSLLPEEREVMGSRLGKERDSRLVEETGMGSHLQMTETEMVSHLPEEREGMVSHL